MGLYVHSLGEIPNGAERAYYVYLLDYGWEEPLGTAVRVNLPRMVDLASRSDAVVIYGPRSMHFEDEVLSGVTSRPVKYYTLRVVEKPAHGSPADLQSLGDLSL